MDQWLASIPKNLLVVGAITLGLAFIVLSDPPHSLCDTQVKEFQENQAGFLYLKEGQSAVSDLNAGTKRKTEFESSRYQCMRSNAAGGCLEFFLKLRDLTRNIGEVSPECRQPLADLPAVKQAVWGMLDLFVKIAWGDAPPKGTFARNGWFGAVEMNLFCTYKVLAQELYGREAWEQQREIWMKSLPGAANLDRTQIWDRILLSANCRKY